VVADAAAGGGEVTPRFADVDRTCTAWCCTASVAPSLHLAVEKTYPLLFSATIWCCNTTDACWTCGKEEALL
jgi:hypothetical protein